MLQLSQRPLADTEVDRELFVDRGDELAELQRAYHLSFNALLLAERGIGTTSLVRRLQGVLGAQGVPAYCVDASLADGVGEVLAAIERAVRADPDDTNDPDDTERRIERLGDRVTGRPLVIVDGAHDASLVHTLFGRFRDQVWELPFTWLVCGLADRRAAYLQPPADAFFETQLRLGPLDDAAARELLERRLARATTSEAAVAEQIRSRLDALVAAGQGRPRQLLAAARDVALGSGRQAGFAAALLAEAAKLGRPAGMLAAELQALGAASASDEELLRRLGWTRARATQVFRELLQAGIVEAHRERIPGSAGRPRTVYSLNTGARLAS